MVTVVLAALLAQADGGVDTGVEGVRRATATVTRGLYLKRGSRPPPVAPPPANDAFQVLCRKVASACAFNRAVWSGDIFMFKLDPDGDLRKARLDPPPPRSLTAFGACVRDGLEGQRVPRKGLGPMAVCNTLTTPTSHIDTQQVIERVAGCLGPDTIVKRLDVAFAEVVEGQTVKLVDLTITGDLPVDLETETCIRRATAVPDFDFVEADRPPFTRKEQKLTVNIWDDAPEQAAESKPGAGTPPASK